MREQLAKLAGQRQTFTATYIKSGQRLRNRWQILPTLLFWDVRPGQRIKYTGERMVN